MTTMGQQIEREPLLSSSAGEQPQKRTSRCAARRLSLRAGALLFILGVTSIVLWTRGYQRASGDIQSCAKGYQNGDDVPSVGLALSLSHATAAIVWPNGSSETIGAVRAEDEYVEVMKRLAQISSQHIRPPYYPFHWLDPGETLRQWLRSGRKKIGLPATDDVGKLAKPLQPLLEKVNTRLGCKQTDMMLVTVGVQALYDEDAEDIMQHLGLQQLPLRHYPSPRMGCEQPHELASAYAAHGLGLCNTYWNATACAQEESDMSFELVLSLSYTEKGIALSHAGFRSAYIDTGYDDTMSDTLGFEGWGSDYKSGYDNEIEYWWTVREMLATHVRSNLRHNYTRLFILDNMAEEDAQQLQDIMEDVLDQWQPGVVRVYRDQQPLFTAAIGAAKLALHGRYVKVDTPTFLPFDLHSESPNPTACPWYGYTID